MAPAGVAHMRKITTCMLMTTLQNKMHKINDFCLKNQKYMNQHK